MKIYTEENKIKCCAKCDGDDFKPAGNGEFNCRNCGEPETGKTKLNRTGETE